MTFPTDWTVLAGTSERVGRDCRMGKHQPDWDKLMLLYNGMNSLWWNEDPLGTSKDGGNRKDRLRYQVIHISRAVVE